MSVNVTNSIPATLNDLLVKLKILSMVERGKKINMGTMTFIDASSWLGSISRSMSGEGRKGLMAHLSQIVQQAINAINEYQSTEFCGLIVNHLAEAKVGIISLKTTYQSDPSIVAQLDVCISNIDLQLNKNRNLLEGHQQENRHTNTAPIYIHSQPAFGPNGIPKISEISQAFNSPKQNVQVGDTGFNSPKLVSSPNLQKVVLSQDTMNIDNSPEMLEEFNNTNSPR